jgi:Protein of unknwon function (DUF3310)
MDIWDKPYYNYLWRRRHQAGDGGLEEVEKLEQELTGKQRLLEKNVEHPSHYNQGNIECLDAIKSALSPEEFQGFIKGTVIKYMWRAKHKGQMEDLKKASFYLNWMLNSPTKK